MGAAAGVRPWRDGQDVLKLALRHLHEVFVITPSGALIAPNVIELRLNPENLRSLGELMEPELISLSAAQVYEDQVAAHGASFAGHGPADVRVIADPSVPLGRYQLRQGQPVDAGYQAGPAVRAPRAGHDGAGPRACVRRPAARSRPSTACPGGRARGLRRPAGRARGALPGVRGTRREHPLAPGGQLTRA